MIKGLPLVAGALWLGVVGARALPAQPEGGPQTSTAIEAGGQLFETYCASCHGISGQGNGPLAEILHQRPADLTQIAMKNGGMFPAIRVQRIVDGRDIEAHGNREMPVWGDAFKTTRDGYTEESVKARIQAVVKYLESIQRRQAD